MEQVCKLRLTRGRRRLAMRAEIVCGQSFAASCQAPLYRMKMVRERQRDKPPGAEAEGNALKSVVTTILTLLDTHSLAILQKRYDTIYNTPSTPHPIHPNHPNHPTRKS